MQTFFNRQNTKMHILSYNHHEAGLSAKNKKNSTKKRHQNDGNQNQRPQSIFRTPKIKKVAINFKTSPD